MYDKHTDSLSRSSRAKMVALAFFLGSVASLQTAATPYQLIDLGIDVSPTDINNSGTIVGTRKTDTGSIGFRWLPGGQLVEIPGATIANAVNDIDQVTGNTLTGAFLLDNAFHEWSGYGGYGINELGQISGYKQLNNPYRPSPLPLDPAIYTPNKWDNLGVATVYSRGTRQGVYADLYVLDDINDSGFAVGKRSRYGLTGSSAILTTPAFNEVIYLPFPYGGTAAAINNLNKIVGTSGTNSTAGAYAHAHLYEYDTGNLIDLGTLNGGLTSSAADINELDQIVGSSWLVTQLTSLYDPTLYHAFLWVNGQMTDLNDDPAVIDSGWILTAATAINDYGDIVGTGLLDGQVHGFLLTTEQTQPVGEPPVAMINADTTAGKAPLTVNFSADGSYDPDGSIVTFVWDFGDSSGTSTATNPQYVYTEPGIYAAVLTVTDDLGKTATAQVEITVRQSKGKGKP